MVRDGTGGEIGMGWDGMGWGLRKVVEERGGLRLTIARYGDGAGDGVG